MNKCILLLTIIVLMLTGCSTTQDNKTDLATIELPVISVGSSDEKIVAAFYEKGFDFNYESLPELSTAEEEIKLKVELSDAFPDSIELGEDYYANWDGLATVNQVTHNLTKDANNQINLDILRNNSEIEESAIYYLKNKQGTFVFKLVFETE